MKEEKGKGPKVALFAKRPHPEDSESDVGGDGDEDNDGHPGKDNSIQIVCDPKIESLFYKLRQLEENDPKNS
jgi:hypothetical protein